MINIQFFYDQWYLMALDITETKSFKEPKEIIKKSIAKYRCNLTFKRKAFDFIDLAKILRLREVLKLFHLILIFLIFPW